MRQQEAPPSGSRTVAANVFWQLASFAARAISGLGVAVLVARWGGPRGLGVFQFALTITAMLPFFYGLPSLLAREVARRPEEGSEWVEGGTLIAILFGAAFTAMFAIGVHLFDVSPQTQMAIPLASLGMTFDGIARVQFAAAWAWERMRLETVATVVQEVAFVVATALVLMAGGGIRGALLAFVASRALGALVGWVIVARRLGRLPIPWAPLGSLRRMVRQCTPFAINDTLTLTYMRADVVILGIAKGPVPVGLYQAGTNLVLYLNVLARCINHALYPRMSKAWPRRPEQFRRLRDSSFRIISVISLPITVASLLLASQIFRFLYGAKFDRGVLTYQLLVLVIPVRMLGHTLSVSLSAADRQTRRTVAVTAAAGVNVALNLYFIPRWSYLGAGITTVICETGLLLTYAAFLRHVAGPSGLLRALAVPAAAALPMAVVIVATTGAGLLVSMTAGAITYCAAIGLVALVRVPREQRQHPTTVLLDLVRPAA